MRKSQINGNTSESVRWPDLRGEILCPVARLGIMTPSMGKATLAQVQAITDIARRVTDFLPGSSPSASTYTFASAAKDAGVAQFWSLDSSKMPSITRLIEQTLLQRPSSFCPLMEVIVRNGLKYRSKKGTPLSRQDIEGLNKDILRLGFKIPELWDTGFLDSLPGSTQDGPPPTPPRTAATAARRAAALVLLEKQLNQLHAMDNRQAAGLQLETLLTELFDVFGLEPGQGFRVRGEQIDGSFVLDQDVYLLEAKWEKSLIDIKELYTFRTKVEGKSSMTRGLFLSMSGFSDEALAALTTGKQPTFILMGGVDLYDVATGQVALDALLRAKVRHLAETGTPFISSRVLHQEGRLTR